MKLHKKSRHSVAKLLLFVLGVLMVIATAFYVFYQYTYVDSVRKQATQTLQDLSQQQKALAAALDAKKKEPVIIELPGAKPITAIVEDYSTPGSLWALVNKTHAISLDYAPTELVVPDVETRKDKSVEERSVRKDIADPLKTMFAAAAVDGHNLMIGSAYRSAALQKVYFDSYAAASGEEAANQYSAHPGESEHQTGLAVDISTVSQNCYLSECFTTTPDGQWLADHAYEYGFILRYPKGKEIITGYQFEPWHYRYVGISLATALHESGLTFEEAYPYLEKALAILKSNGAI